MSPLPILTPEMGVTPLFSPVLSEAGQVGGSVSISETSRGVWTCELDGEEEIFAFTSSKPGYKTSWESTRLSHFPGAGG